MSKIRNVMAAGSLLAAAANPAWTQTLPVPQNVMSLAATATAEVTMDLLSISFSTTREGADAAAVQSQLKQALDAALSEARRVAKPGQLDVRTGNFSMAPRYAPKGGINGWQGTVQLVVEGRDTVAISQLAGKVTTLTIARVSYGLSRETREQAEADTTAQAIARFRERALQQAVLFGFTSYQIREVQVGTQEPPNFAPVSAMRMQASPAGAGESLPVEAGKASVSSTVSGSVQMMK